MSKDIRCKDCVHRTYTRLLKKFQLSQTQESAFLKYYNIALAEERPELHRRLQKKFSFISGVDDPFADEKKQSNLIANDLYKYWQPKVIQSENPFDMALRLAVAANIMDYGANNNFNLNDTIEKVLHTDFAIDHSLSLKQCFNVAENVLYLSDNAGEIVFDKLFLEILMHPNVTYAVKDAPILNDANITDALEVGMDITANVISNGYDAPTTILEKCSQEFQGYFNSADLIISKGQGNLESLISLNDKRIFFLLIVKCDVIGELLRVPVNSFVVCNSEFISAIHK